MDVTIADDHIRFLRYEFRGASVHPHGTLTAAQIRGVNWKLAPPEIRTVLGETLFVPAGQRQELEQFCRRNDIAFDRRLDAWGNLLEPFLDTKISDETADATDERLRKAGFDFGEIAEIRLRIAPLMKAYNIDSMLWDWANLGLYDLLRAVSGHLVPAGLPATLGDPAEVYAWAQEIADRPFTSGRPPASA
ncbi:hypothetical protein [Kibdelosporangium persicum]|nr:hypothetical protein [Kibdelosporangium persicum]